MKTLTVAELNDIYSSADSVDKEVFAEQRSNLRLVAGDHYSKKGYEYYRGMRGNDMPAVESQKLRITKNLTHKVYRYYLTNLLDYAPDVAVLPENEKEHQDIKDAELNQSVWMAAKKQYRIKEKKREWAQDFVGVGEVAVKIFFDPDAGEFLGYEQKVDEDGNPVTTRGEPLVDQMTGQQQIDENGEPVFSEEPVADESKPVFKGKFNFERIPAFNLLRSAEAKHMRDAECWIVRKMVAIKKLQGMYAGDKEKLHFIQKSAGSEDFIVFDQATSSYSKSKNQVLVKEYYFPPCHTYPEGYYYITTTAGILEQDVLPFGIFPIAWAGFDEFVSAARARGIVRVARPYQAEINRASSATAMAQITLGEDKILYQAGTRMAQGALLPGIRGLTYQGQAPTVLNGRDGSQYYPYIQGTKDEMYDNLMMNEVMQQKGQTFDPTAFLYANANDRKMFSLYADKFEQFLVDVVDIYLQLAKHYLQDDELIYAVGKREIINIAEFRKTSPLRTQITLEPTTETLENKLGKHLTGMQIMQYVGKQLKPENLGKLIKNMPFANFGNTFDDLVLDEVNAENDILALERGQEPVISEFENNEYTAAQLVKRMKEPDFRFLPQPVQAAYNKLYQQHMQIVAAKEQKVIDAKNEYIPIDGPLCKVDMYVPKTDGTGTERLELPQRTLEWVIEQVQKQGASLDKFKQMNQGQLANLADMIVNGRMAMAAGQQPVAA